MEKKEAKNNDCGCRKNKDKINTPLYKRLMKRIREKMIRQ